MNHTESYCTAREVVCLYYYCRWFRASRIISSLPDDNAQVVKIRERWTEIVVTELRKGDPREMLGLECTGSTVVGRWLRTIIH